MPTLLHHERGQLEELCRQFGVRKLDVFGSAIRTLTGAMLTSRWSSTAIPSGTSSATSWICGRRSRMYLTDR